MRRFTAPLVGLALVAGLFAAVNLAPTGGLTLAPIADARINKLATGTNYGAGGTLRGDADDYDSLLTFSVNGWVAGSTVSLRVFVTDPSVAGMQVYATTAFTEATVTWATAPAKGIQRGTLPAGTSGTWISTPISGVTGNGSYSYRMSSTSTDGITFYSREGASPPELIVTSPAATSTPTASPTSSPSPSPSPASTPSPTPTATPPASLTLPVRAAFYYPWFPESWSQLGYNPFTRYHPTLGFYDSSNASVIQSHVASLQSAGIQAGIASWWGQGTPTDGRVPALLANAGTFRWALYYEQEGTTDPSIAAIAADLDYIAARYSTSPAYLRVGGKPVLFVYNANDINCTVADRWAAANAGRFYLQLKVFPGYTACANQPSGWHQYAPAVPEDHQVGYSFSISPGFWRLDEPAPRLARDLARFRTNVAHMGASGEPWQLVTTFNEWGEGSSVEPADEWGTAYLDALGGIAPSATPTASPSASPSPSSTATSTPTPTSSSGSDPVVLAAGDIASSGSGDSSTALILDGQPGTILTLGDNVYNDGTLAQFNSYYEPTWGRHKARTRPATGNHDYGASAAAQGMRDYFGFGTVPLYYSFDLGTWHLVAMDAGICYSRQPTACNAGQAQETWLKADLAAHPNLCTLVYWHQPRWSSGSTHGSDPKAAAFWNASVAGGVDVALAGHDHGYERFAPQNAAGTLDLNGMREFVVGTGGAALYSFGTPKANSEVRYAGGFGVLRLVLHPGSYDWTYLSEAGKTFTDSGSTACH